MKCKRNTDGRKLDHVSLQTMRNQAVKAVRNGQTVQSVANAYGLNIRTVFRWLSAYAAGGQKALQARAIPGRPPKLSGEQLSWLAAAVRSHTPQQLQVRVRAVDTEPDQRTDREALRHQFVALGGRKGYAHIGLHGAATAVPGK